MIDRAFSPWVFRLTSRYPARWAGMAARRWRYDADWMAL